MGGQGSRDPKVLPSQTLLHETPGSSPHPRIPGTHTAIRCPLSYLRFLERMGMPKETSGADGYIFTIWLQWWGWGEEGGSRGKELKRMKTQESQVLLLRNYVTLVVKSTFLSPNVLICRGGLNHVAPGWAVRIKQSTLCTADTASTAPNHHAGC